MQRVIGLLILLAHITMARADTTWVAGAVSGHWQLTNSPVMATGNLVVNAEDYLTIAPGVEIVFTGFFSLEIWGRFDAVGSADSMIVFRASEELTPDGWRGLLFDTREQVFLIYCKIQQVTPLWGARYRGALTTHGTNLQVRNVTFEEITAEDCSVMAIRDGSELFLFEVTCVDVSGIVGYCGGVMNLSNSIAEVENSTFDGATAAEGGGFCADESYLSMKNCTLSNLTGSVYGGAIYLNLSTLVMDGCLLRGNRAGAGSIFYSRQSWVDARRCTFVEHGDDELDGYLFYSYYQAHYGLNSCIFANNTGRGFTGELAVRNTCDYNNPGGPLEGESNVFDDPLFVDPENGDYHLTAESPCIDAGDPDLPLDPDGTRADIGAFCFDQSTSAVKPPAELPRSLRLLPAYPNPFNSEITLRFELPYATQVSLTIYDLLGREQAQIVNTMFPAGSHEASWSPRDASGIYWAVLASGFVRSTQKLIYVR